MSKCITKFSANDTELLRMDITYNTDSEHIGFISMGYSYCVAGVAPENMPIETWLSCLYRFNRVVSQMCKPIEKLRSYAEEAGQ